MNMSTISEYYLLKLIPKVQSEHKCGFKLDRTLNKTRFLQSIQKIMGYIGNLVLLMNLTRHNMGQPH